METPSIQNNTRIDVADVLRGLAVMGIILLHSIEHYNFYYFPENPPFEWMKFADRIIWDGLFFTFSGKAYAVFALLFGFSFYIQNNNQNQKGKDFRLRFLWRLVLLFIIGQFNASFFTGEILVMYSIIGIILPVCCKLNDKTITIIATLLILQPLDWGKLIYALIDTSYTPSESLSNYYFGVAYDMQKNGTFLETLRMNLWEGQLANFTWAFEHGRIMQTAALFLFGMLIGRRQLFIHTPKHELIWLKTLGFALILFFPLYGLKNLLPEFINRPGYYEPLNLILYSLSNLSFMLVLVTGGLLTFYKVKNRSFLMRFSSYGKMSLTNYIGQSIIGSLFFYHWGFFLSPHMNHTLSFLFGILFVLLQMSFCSWWLKRHKHGPFEGLWKYLTWVRK